MRKQMEFGFSGWQISDESKNCGGIVTNKFDIALKIVK